MYLSVQPSLHTREVLSVTPAWGGGDELQENKHKWEQGLCGLQNHAEISAHHCSQACQSHLHRRHTPWPQGLLHCVLTALLLEHALLGGGLRWPCTWNPLFLHSSHRFSNHWKQLWDIPLHLPTSRCLKVPYISPSRGWTSSRTTTVGHTCQDLVPSQKSEESLLLPQPACVLKEYTITFTTVIFL